MDDRLGHAGGAGRVDDPERMVERYRLDAQRLVMRQHLRPVVAADRAGYVDFAADGRNQHEVGQRGQGGDEIGDHRRAVVGLAAVAVAVDGNQHLGRNLPKAVDHGHLAHVRRAAGPDRAQAGRGQEGDDRGRHVGQVAGHAVTRRHAHRAQGMGEGGDLGFQGIPAHVGQRLGLAGMADGRALACLPGAGVAEDLLDVIERGAVEPARTGHGAVVQHAPGGGVEVEVEVDADGVPERLDVGDRPAPEAVVVIEGEAALAAQPCDESGQLAALGKVGGRRPHQLSGCHGHACLLLFPSARGFGVRRWFVAGALTAAARRDAWSHHNRLRRHLAAPPDSNSVPHMASTRALTAGSIEIVRPHSRVVSPGHLSVASMPIFEPRPETGEAKSR